MRSHLLLRSNRKRTLSSAPSPPRPGTARPGQTSPEAAAPRPRKRIRIVPGESRQQEAVPQRQRIKVAPGELHQQKTPPKRERVRIVPGESHKEEPNARPDESRPRFVDDSLHPDAIRKDPKRQGRFLGAFQSAEFQLPRESHADMLLEQSQLPQHVIVVDL